MSKKEYRYWAWETIKAVVTVVLIVLCVIMIEAIAS